MGFFKAIGAFFTFLGPVWSFFMSPKKQKERADSEADKAVADRDEKKVNELLDKGLKVVVLAGLFVCGCATRVVVIPADKEVHFLPAGQSYTAPVGGIWLMPPARMQEILRKLNTP